MAANIEDLNKNLLEIAKILKDTAKLQAGAPGAATKMGAPMTIADHFKKTFERAKLDAMSPKNIPGMNWLAKSAGAGAGIAGPMGAVMGPVISLGMEMAKLPGRVREFAEGLHQANRAFASVSPSMALVMAQSDFRDQMRRMEMGENLAGSAGNLANARGNLEDQFAPLDTAIGNFQNNLGAVITDAVATFLEQSEWFQQAANWIEEMSDTLEGILEWLGTKKDKDEKDGWEAEIENMARNEDIKRIERAEPVRKPAGPQRDPRPNFPWDKR